MANKNKNIRCSFCGNPAEHYFTGGNGSVICFDCIIHGNDILKMEFANHREKDTFSLTNLPKPHEMKAYLDQYVIGQERAKKTLTVAIYNHYKRLMQAQEDETEIEKSNIIMVGRTGTGKTLIARTIAKMLQVPFAMVDATVLTQAGYVGEDVESLLVRLLEAADYDINKTERGIVFIDEIDKIARKGDNPSITRDVSGEGVQQALLKLLEGSIVKVPPKGGRKHPEQEFINIDTHNILFICGGAFDGIEQRIAQRKNTQMVGFDASEQSKRVDRNNMLQYIAPQDLKAFGLIPEIVGRLPILTYLDPLDKKALRNILTEPKNAIVKQYKKLLSMDKVDLKFSDDALDYIVDKALEYKLGARGLRSLTEVIMTDIMYEIPQDPETTTYTITLDLAKEKIEQSDKLG